MYLVDFILKKDTKNPFYSSNSLLIVARSIYNGCITRRHTPWPGTLHVVSGQDSSGSYIQVYGVDRMEPGCHTRSNKSALGVLFQGSLFRREPAMEECSQASVIMF